MQATESAQSYLQLYTYSVVRLHYITDSDYEEKSFCGLLHITRKKTRNRKEQEMDSMKFSCQKCRYIYDPKSDVDEGVAFDELPGDWLCPKCFSADKSEFIAMNKHKSKPRVAVPDGIPVTAQ